MYHSCALNDLRFILVSNGTGKPANGWAKDFRERLAQSNRSALKVFQRQGKHDISLGKMQRRA
jgi:hypothetical protein